MKVCFLSGFKEVTGGAELDLAYQGSLSGLVEALCVRYGEGLRRLVMDTERPGERNPFVKILVDGEDVRSGNPELAGKEMIFVFFPIAGG